MDNINIKLEREKDKKVKDTSIRNGKSEERNFLDLSKEDNYTFNSELTPPGLSHDDVFPTTIHATEKDGEKKDKVLKGWDYYSRDPNEPANFNTVFKIEYTPNTSDKMLHLSCGHCDTLRSVNEATEKRIKYQYSNIKSEKYTSYDKLVSDDSRHYAIRAYAPDTLASRLHRSPALNDADKLWIAYQIICGLEDLHSAKFCHGCIKPENILIYPCNRVSIADPGLMHPVCVPADNPMTFIRVFKGGNGCYLAPERMTLPRKYVYICDDGDSEGECYSEPGSGSLMGDDEDSPKTLKEEMDIFSAGCVIAYMFLNGRDIFNFKTITAYKNGQYLPKDFVNRIKCDFARKIVEKMINRVASKRPSAETLLREFPQWLKTFDIITRDAVAQKSPGEAVLYLCKNVSLLLPTNSNRYSQQGSCLFQMSSFSLSPSSFSSMPSMSPEQQQQQQSLTMKRRHIPNGASPSSFISNEEKADQEAEKSMLFIASITNFITKCEDRGTLTKGLDVLYKLAQQVPDTNTKVAGIFPYLWHYVMRVNNNNGDQLHPLCSHALRLSASLLQTVPELSGLWCRIVTDCVLPDLNALLTNKAIKNNISIGVTLAMSLPVFAEAGLRFYLSRSNATFDVKTRDDYICILRRSFATLFSNLVNLYSSSPTVLIAALESAPLMAAVLGPELTCSLTERMKNPYSIVNFVTVCIDSPIVRVREAAARAVPGVASVLTPTVVEEALLPLVEGKGVYDKDPCVVAASLDAIAALCDLGMLRRKTLRTLWRVCLQTTLLPSAWVRFAGIGATTAVCNALGQVDTELFVDFVGSGIAELRPGKVSHKSLEKVLKVWVMEKSAEKALNLVSNGPQIWIPGRKLEEKLNELMDHKKDIPKIIVLWSYLEKCSKRFKEIAGHQNNSLYSGKLTSKDLMFSKSTKTLNPQKTQGSSKIPPCSQSFSLSLNKSNFSGGCFTVKDQKNNTKINRSDTLRPIKQLTCAGEPAFKVRTTDSITVSVSRGGKLCFWDTKKASSKGEGAEDGFIEGACDIGRPVYSLALDDRGRVFCGTKGAVLVVIDVHVREIQEYPTPQDYSEGRALDDVVAIECTGDGVWYGLRNGNIYLLDLDNHKEAELRGDIRHGMLETFIAVPENNVIIAGTSRGYYKVWNTESRALLAMWRQPTKGRIRSLAALDCNYFVATTESGQVLSWNYTPGNDVPRLAGEFYPPIAGAGTEAMRNAERAHKDIVEAMKSMMFVAADTKKEEYDNANEPRKSQDMYWARQTVACAKGKKGGELIFFTGGMDSQVRQWGVDKANLSYTLGPGTTHVEPQVVDNIVLTVAYNRNVLPQKFYIQKGISDMCLTEDGSRLFVAYGDGTIKVWEVKHK